MKEATSTGRTGGRQIRVLFWWSFAFALLLAGASLFGVRQVVRSLSDVAFDDANALISAQQLRIWAEVKGRTARSFLLTGDEHILPSIASANEKFAHQLEEMAARADGEDHDLLHRVDLASRDYDRALQRAIALRRSSADEAVKQTFEHEVQPAREELNHAINEVAFLQQTRLGVATKQARQDVSFTLTLLIGLAATAILATALLQARLGQAVRALDHQREETARYLAKLEDLNAELDAFAGRVAHDLRNLITPVSLVASLLRRSDASGSAPPQVGDMLDRTVNRALGMLDGLLAFSRSGQPDPQATCSLAAAVHDALEQLAPLTSRVGADIECDVEDSTVHCSRELLNVVVLNLVGNALKVLEGRPRRTVKVSARSSDGRNELVVADTGPGIPPEARERIFEPFYRVPGNTTAGSGIGLATVHRIVVAHEGHIAVESELGHGATFRVDLPCGETPPSIPE